MKKDTWDVKGRYQRGIREQRGMGLGALFAVALVAMAGAGCGLLKTPTGGTTVIVTNTTTQTQGGTPGASPSPGPAPAGAIASVRVGTFGYDCPSGTATPNNSSGVVPIGCTASVTATPKDATGADVPAAVHGPVIAWTVNAVPSSAASVTEPGEAFNRDVHGLAAGVVHLSATVQGVTGTLDLTVR